MLRVFKPTSPMSHGSWSLVAYGLPMSLLAAEQYARDAEAAPRALQRATELLPIRMLSTLGIPCSLVLATYPGVLLATTSNPLWSRSRLLGAVFACGSFHAGAAAIRLVLGREEDAATARLDRIERIAAAAEATSLGAYLATTGRNARPLLAGPHARLFWIGAVGAGIALPWLLKAIAPRCGRWARVARLAGSVLSLAGSFALKWAITQAGKTAARDARLNHEASRARSNSTARTRPTFASSTPSDRS
jgi:formate-dependent nitrite reductase membrane component NrfD